MKLTKIQKLGLFSIPVLVGIYLIYKQFKKPKQSGRIGEYVPPPTPKPVENNPTTTPCDYPLKKGVYDCAKVQMLQWALNHIPYTSYDSTTNLVKYRPLKMDGDFGEKTQAVLIDFWKDGAYVGGNSVITTQVSNKAEMDLILSYVIEDEAAFQAAENPYVVAPPAPEPPVVNPFPTYP